MQLFVVAAIIFSFIASFIACFILLVIGAYCLTAATVKSTARKNSKPTQSTVMRTVNLLNNTVILNELRTADSQAIAFNFQT